MSYLTALTAFVAYQTLYQPGKDTPSAVCLLMEHTRTFESRAEWLKHHGMQDIEPEFAAILNKEFWNLI